MTAGHDRLAQSTLHAVIFDAEGVVVDTEGAWDQAQREFLRNRGVAYDRDKVKHLLTGRSGAQGIRVLVDLYGLEGDPRELEHERRELMRGHLSERVSFVDGFLDFYRETSRRYATALATAMDLDLFAVVDASLRLRELFNGQVTTLDQVDHRAKPDPDLFLLAARNLKVPPARCAVIEDAPLGVEAAKRAGMVAVGLATTYRPELLGKADLVAENYAGIELDHLERLAAKNRVAFDESASGW